MNCEAARQVWHEQLESGDSATVLQEHLRGCAACRAYCADMERVLAGLAELRRESQEIEAIRYSRADSSPVSAQSPLRIAAAIALLIGGLLVMRVMLTNGPRASGPPHVAELVDAGPELPPDPPTTGITLKGEASHAQLAVATPTQNPQIRLYWLYPSFNDERSVQP